MRKILLTAFCISCLIGLICKTTTAQNTHKNTINFGVGYFGEFIEHRPGSIIWIEGGRLISNGFYTSLKLSHSQNSYILGEEWGIFQGQRRVFFQRIAGLKTSKPFRLFNSNHFIEPGFGLGIVFEYSNYPNYEFELIHDEAEDVLELYYYIDAGFEQYMDLIFNASTDYYYIFQNGLFLGARTNFYITSVGIEYYAITPIIGFRF